ncbi:MAG: serine dehydratase subunit alpha family protein [Lachnospiraceae bacterium]
MNELTKLILEDMKPALGVTEPGAIAYAAAKAKSYVEGEVEQVRVALNSGMYKNAFTCGIPNSSEVGNVFAAALGVVAGNDKKGLEALADVCPEDNDTAKRLIEEGKVRVELSGITSRIFIEAFVKTTNGEATVTIRDSHTNIVKIVVNGKIVLDKESEEVLENKEENKTHAIHNYTLEQLVKYVETEAIEELLFIREAYKINWELFEEGLRNPRTTFARYLLEKNGGKIISSNEQATASLLCNAAIEARVIGLDKPAMSITGSGAHGIIATMPLYAAYKVNGYCEEKLLRATALSYLVCMYIKEYSGKLSAFCGCAIAAGTGMACALVYLRGGTTEMMKHAINNMASSITGMICDGGNQGCTMKGIAAVDAAYQSVDFAMHGIYIQDVHGINGNTAEETMRNMGLIASPGMVETEGTIVKIFEDKLKK